jgi:Spy/CpxP family protein refolding chaperone
MRRITMRRIFRLAALGGAILLGGWTVAAQAPPVARPNAPAEDPGVSPAEIQRLFDGFALMQAENFLKLSEDQFARFLSRYKALQDLRRQGLQQHTRIVNDLRWLVNAPALDEAQVRDRLKMLADLDATSAADVKKAYDAVDQVLDLPQQAKFRVFEENMERRKLDLVTRARQANRPKQ